MDTDSKGYTFVDSEPESPPSFGLFETVVKDCLGGILWVVYESGTCRSLNAVRNAKETQTHAEPLILLIVTAVRKKLQAMS
ncbi:hypothetical protein HO173_002311 [Letharia columbiana]|uniref:Uncharacterized protein n=1 Tax=Letharia columbiana TaxID=112416 RepID=A0A8H6L8T2_9LECA|nr:uncharacterized protein HO173_002311 [Letharia columbiana]KAF6239765.1 hypothetical protein HO173_002311 [Letharia columbiana]